MFLVYTLSIAAGIFLVAYGLLNRPAGGKQLQEDCAQTVLGDLAAPDGELITLKFSDERRGKPVDASPDAESPAHKEGMKSFLRPALWASIAKRFKSPARRRLDTPVVKGVVLSPKAPLQTPEAADKND